MKRSNEESQDKKPRKRLRSQREIQWNEKKFEEITTHGIKIMPKNIAKYSGSIVYDKYQKQWRLYMHQHTDNRYSSRHKTQQEAEERKIEIATRENLVKNIVYIYKNEYYCVLTRKQIMKFDYRDIEIVDKYIWCAMLAPHGMSFYASSQTQTEHGTKSLKFHRLLFPNIEKGMTVDHINPGETLDNTRSNLRLATNSMQVVNQRLRLDNKSGIKGVNYRSSNNSWYTQWVDDEGHQRSKTFRISKYGETAKEKAIAYRTSIELTTARYNCVKIFPT